MDPINDLWRRLDRSEHEKLAKTLSSAIICVCLLGIGWILYAYPSAAHATGAGAGGNVSPTIISETVSPQPETVSLPELIPGRREMGIVRLALLHTTRPDRPAFEVVQYTVKTGDTIFDIAKKFGLKPSSILWGNLLRLGDNPEMIFPDQELNILPEDGVYYDWHENDSLNKVAEVLGVKPDDIVDYPGNHLNRDTLGDFARPNIPVGTWIIVPGGYRNFITWSAPTISRFNPSAARLYGPGACSKPTDGAVGSGSFTFPTVAHWLSGYDYTPGANHSAVDFGGAMGNAIYAADNGVIVYAGWNDHGYGNVTVIDHGNGYQTLYAHQSQIRVECGQSVIKGDLIGNMGSTGNSSGPHLHFEMWDSGVHVNPHDYLAISQK